MHPLNTTDYAHVHSTGPSSVGLKFHITPQLQFGISAFEDMQSTVLFLNLDSGVGLQAEGLGSHTSPFCVEAYTEFYSSFGVEATFYRFLDATAAIKIFDLIFPLYKVCHASTWLPLALPLTLFFPSAPTRNANFHIIGTENNVLVVKPLILLR